MAFTPELAERRFGYGLSGHLKPVPSIASMLDGILGPDQIADRFPLPPFSYIQEKGVLRGRFVKFARERSGTPEAEDASKKARDVALEVRGARAGWFARTQVRRIQTRDSFRERLVAFWGDHFTAEGSGHLFQFAESLYVNEAVRPFIAGRFGDLLVSCVTHPLMLHYLDQEVSAGPNSPIARRQGRGRGLNENLAREVLELHTLGVGGPYDQEEVRKLAHLFTGMSRGRDLRFMFRNGLVEPGPQTVLGRTYDATPSMVRIEAVLQDLAMHPATALHLAQKLAVHFLSDSPPKSVVQDMAAAYLARDGALMALYEVLLNSNEAWQLPATNIRPPLEFVSAALRALSVPTPAMEALGFREVNRQFLVPLKVMGQFWQKPAGPDGWSEADEAWITPQGIAARVEWAMRAPKTLMETLPDSREFVHIALGPDVPEQVAFAARAAESRAEAIGLVLLSPAFQRR